MYIKYKRYTMGKDKENEVHFNKQKTTLLATVKISLRIYSSLQGPQQRAILKGGFDNCHTCILGYSYLK